MTKKTINNTFSLLSEYYSLEYRDLAELDLNHIAFLNYKNVDLSSYKYALCLYYGQDQMLDIVYFTSDKSIDYNERFNFYLQKLKTVDITSISILVTYLFYCDDFQSVNPFEFQVNYPSEFSMYLLHNTNGYVLYRYQLLELLKICQPYDGDLDLNHTIKSFNLKKHSLYDDLQNMILPDNYKLYDLLKNYTPLGSTNNTFGIVVEPDYKISYAFYKSISNNFNLTS
jgi:hypothetical protein